MKEDKGVIQLKCDIIEAGIEAFALGFFCVLGINPWVSLVLWLIFLQRAYVCVAYAIPLLLPCKFSYWKDKNKFWKHVDKIIKDKYKINI